MKPVPTRKKRPHGKWKDSHVVLFVLPVVLTILYPGRGILYLHGRFSPYALTRMAVIWLFPVASVFILWCFIWGIVRLVRHRKERIRNEVLLIAVETCIPLVSVGLFLASFHFTQPYRGNDLFMFGLRDRIRSKADIGAIRAWMQSLDPEDYEDGNRIWGTELPKSLRVLDRTAVLCPDENGNAMISLGWGSGVMGHWGVRIGMKDMEIPPSDFRLYGVYIVPVEPGVYVWERFE